MAGLFFLPGNVSATHRRLRRLLFRPCNYTANATKQLTGLYRGISVNSTHSKAHNTAATQADYAPPAPRWRAYRQALHLHQYPDTAATPDAVQLSTAAYYNKVYKSAPLPPVMDSCQTVQHITDHVSPAACSLAPVSSRGAAGGAEPLTATAVSLFGLSPDN